jgi:hypothetical protein
MEDTKKRLQTLNEVFTANGGRGVELAEEIDTLRSEINLATRGLTDTQTRTIKVNDVLGTLGYHHVCCILVREWGEEELQLARIFLSDVEKNTEIAQTLGLPDEKIKSIKERAEKVWGSWVAWMMSLPVEELIGNTDVHLDKHPREAEVIKWLNENQGGDLRVCCVCSIVTADWGLCNDGYMCFDCERVPGNLTQREIRVFKGGQDPSKECPHCCEEWRNCDEELDEEEWEKR